MLETVKEFNPEKIIEILIRRRWFIIIPFCLSMIAGMYLAVKLPKVYSSETLILVEPQKVPPNYVKPIVSADANNRISTISQQIMSRSNLEKIIDKFKLYANSGQEHIFIEDKIEYMRNSISVKLIRKRGSEAFSISFKGRSPEIVMKVTNTLSTNFINENLKFREAQGIQTSSFLESQMNVKRKQLEHIEESLKQYRKKNMGELPEQLETNLRALDRIQQRIDDRQQAIRDIRSQLVALTNQQEIYQSKLKGNDRSTDGFHEEAHLVEDDSDNLSQLKANLEELKLRYTDFHPDVRNIKKKISKIEAEKETEKTNKEIHFEVTQNNNEKIDTEITSKFAFNKDEILDLKRSDLLDIQKAELNEEIIKIKAEIYKLNDEMQKYQNRVENTPKREQELLSLKRDYDNINDAYNSLLNRKIEAEIAVSMEKQQEGEHFRILDYAQLPEKPISPNMIALFFLAVAGGLGIGGCLVYLTEFFNKSFRSAEEIEILLGISVAITLPVIKHPKDLMKQKVSKFLSAIFITISFVLFFGFGILTFRGVEQTQQFVDRFITMWGK